MAWETFPQRERDMTTARISPYGCASFASRPYRDAVRDIGAASSAAADDAAPDAAAELTLQEAADALGVHYMTAYRYVRLGLLAAGR